MRNPNYIKVMSLFYSAATLNYGMPKNLNISDRAIDRRKSSILTKNCLFVLKSKFTDKFIVSFFPNYLYLLPCMLSSCF